MKIPRDGKKPRISGTYNRIGDAESYVPPMNADGDSFHDQPDPLYDFALRLLPQNPEIMNALHHVDAIAMAELIAAAILEEESRRHLPAAELDSMCAALILLGSKNADDLVHVMDSRTIAYVLEAGSLKGTLDEKTLATATPAARRICLAYTVAELEYNDKCLKETMAFVPSTDRLAALAAHVTLDAATGGAQKNDADRAMTARAVSVFNDLAKRIEMPLVLDIAADGKVVQRAAAPKKKDNGPKPR